MKAFILYLSSYLISTLLLLVCFSLSSVAQTKWYKYPGNPVFQPGKSSEWDMAKIAHTVLFEEGQYNMWYKGWSDHIPGFMGIGYASSPDGIHWQKYTNNPLEFNCEGTSWDIVFDAFDVIKKDSLYLMWYAGIDKKTNIWNIGFAWSENGLSWTKLPEPVLWPGEDDDWDAAAINGATVHFDGINYHMWYNARDTSWVQRIGYATSDDGIHWKKHPANPVLEDGGPGTWDEHWISVYCVNYNGSFYEMWYDGFDKINNQVGYATSMDGVNWIKSPDNPVLPVGNLGYWDTWIARIPTVVHLDSIYKMWYYGHDYSKGNIGYATTSIGEAGSWDTAKINKPQTKVKVQILNRAEYINVDSLNDILSELSGIELINACNKIALAYSLNDNKKSLELAEKALEMSEKENYPEGRAMALYSIGNSQYIMDNYSEALASQLSALWLFDSLDMQFEHGNLLAQIAGIHSYTGSHDLACRYYQQALEVFEQLNDTGLIINSKMFLGYAYLDFGDTASALKQFRSGLSKAIMIRDDWIQGWCYESIGFCYSGRNLDSALFYFNKANKIWNTAWPEKVNLLNTAEAYFSAGPEYYEEAEQYFTKCFPRFGEGKYHKVRLYLSAAELYFVTGRFDRSKESLDIALDECQRLLDRQDYTMFASLNEKLVVEIDLKRYMEKIYWLFYRLDSTLNDQTSAFKYFKLTTQWKDSIVNQQNKRQWAMMQGTYETEKAQNQISLLEKDNEVKSLTIKRSRIILIGLSALVLLIVLVVIIFIRNRKIKTQHALELEQLKTEKLQELDRLKSRFFANISHEFRTPLTLIMRPLEKLLSKTHDEIDKKELTVARKYAQSLQNLINNLLTLSRLESGKMRLQAKETNLIKLVKGYFNAFESLAIQKNITLSFNTKNEEINAFIDHEKFEQILNNLLSNAFKFTGERGVIEVAVCSQHSAVGKKENEDIANCQLPTADSASQCAEIKISDTGCGIPPEHIDHIFDRFYQVENKNSSYYEGTGIGLALTKELIELHHGKIKVDSELGKGSTFTILLPLGNEHLGSEEIVSEKSEKTKLPAITPVQSDDQDELASMPDSDQDNNDVQPILLIVEDNADMRSYIREYFEDEYKIIEAVDGRDGYEKATDTIPDFIISDVMMPEMDGTEFCKKVKADERTSHIPVVLLTARASKENRMEGLETGAEDFITKPFDGEELRLRVRNLINQQQRIRKLLERKFQTSHGIINVDFEDSCITSMDAQFLQKVVEIVKQHHTDPEFNTKVFGQAIGLGRIQLNRKIKALTGETTVNFIRTFRLNRAAELIKKKSATVAEIAYDVGFSSPSYFSECFRLQFGKLPSEFNEKE